MNEIVEPSGRGRYARRGSAKRTSQINIQMPKTLVAAVDAEATRKGLDSRSEFIRQACLTALRQNEVAV